MTIPTNLRDSFRWFPVRNDHTTECPAFGILQITGVVLLDGTVVLTGTRPNMVATPPATLVSFVANGPLAIPAGKIGLCTDGSTIVVQYYGPDGTPLVGEDWGPKADSWLLHTSGAGYHIFGAVDTTRKTAIVDHSQDIYVAVNTDDSAGYLQVQFVNWNSTPQYNSAQDLTIDLDTEDLAGDKRLRLFIDATGGDITSYNAVVSQVLGHNASGVWTWQPVGGGSDELVKVSADDHAAEYLEDKFTDLTVSTFATTQDLRIKLEVFDVDAGAPNDEELTVYIDASAISNYNQTATELLGHASTGVFSWYELCDHQATPWNAAQDLGISTDQLLSGGSTCLKWFIDASAIPGHHATAEKHLAIVSSVWTWVDPGGVDTDKLVKVTATETAADYLYNQVSGESNETPSTYVQNPDLGITIGRDGADSADQTLRFFIDASGGQINDYIAAEKQELVRWASTDIPASAYHWVGYANLGTRQNSATDRDLDLSWSFEESPVDNWKKHVWIDASAQTGMDTYDATKIQGLGHTASGVWGWFDPGLTKVNSTDTLAYLATQFVNTGTFTSARDYPFNIQDIAGAIKIFATPADMTAGPYTDTSIQMLGHDASGRFSWFPSTAGEDKFVATISGATPGYLENVTDGTTGATPAYDTTDDVLIKVDRSDGTANPKLRYYFDASATPNYGETDYGFLGHLKTPGGVQWFIYNDPYSEARQPTLDLPIDVSIEGSNVVYWFINASQISNYNQSNEQLLTHDSSGMWAWILKSAGVDTDEKVKITSGDDTPQYLDEKMPALSATYDLTRDVTLSRQIINPGLVEQFRLFIDSDGGGTGGTEGLLDYVSGTFQAPYHFDGSADGGSHRWHWVTPGVFATQNLDGTDLEISWQIKEDSANHWKQHVFIDASVLPGYSSTAERHLAVVSGVWQWREPPIPGTSDDKFVRVDSFDTTSGYLLSKLVLGVTAGFVFNEDVQINTRILSPGANESAECFIDSSSGSIEDYIQAKPQVPWHFDGSMDGAGNYRWHWVSQSQPDTFVTTLDLELDSEIIQPVSNDWRIRYFIDASAITSYSQTTVQLLGHASTGAWQWMQDSDEKVKVSATDTADYLDAQFVNYGTVAYESAEDLQIYHATEGSGSAQKVRSFIPSDGGQLIGYVGSQRQLLGHNLGTWQFLPDLNDQVALTSVSTPAYLTSLLIDHGLQSHESAEDLTIHVATVGTQLRWFVAADLIPSHSLSGELHLGILNGQWRFMTPPTPGVGTDKFVAVNNDTPAFLEQQIEGYPSVTAFNTSQDFRVNTELVGTGDQKVRPFIDSDQISNWEQSVTTQFLGITHSPIEQPQWLTPLDQATVFDPTRDLEIRMQNTAGDVRWFIDADQAPLFPSFSPTFNQVLGRAASGEFKWWNLDLRTVLTGVSVVGTTLVFTRQQFQAIEPSFVANLILTGTACP